VADEPGASVSGVAADGFARLYASEHKRLVRTAFLLTGSRAVAEDLVHDAFVRAQGRVGAADRPGAYLHATLANLCRRYLRRQGLEARVRSVLATTSKPDRADATGDHLFDSLASLTPPQRSVLVLRYYLDLPDSDIASTLGCPEPTVRSHASRGLAQLRKVIRDES
jgi:RNA polymerase sigma factor (sigma-70 family)